MIQYDDILSLQDDELINTLTQEFYCPIPLTLDTPEALHECVPLLGKLTNSYAYLSVMLASLKAQVRIEKSRNKEKYQELISKRDTVDIFLGVIKQNYQGLSRMISTHTEEAKELEMLSKS
jgi:hypothetical protein